MMIWFCLIVSLGLAAGERAVQPAYLDQLLAEGKDEEFAKLMGIDVNLVRPKEERSGGSPLFTASPLGDILLTPEQEENARQGVKFSKYPSLKWPNNEIPYVISNEYNSTQRGIITDAINDFNEKVDNVKLVPRRWFFGQRDYMMVFNGNGCYTYLGRRGRQQPLSLQISGCISRGTVQHEFMHAAGFSHEQNRPDRDDYIELLPENIPPKWQSQYEKESEDDFHILGPYDYHSVMHYPVQAPESGGKPAFKVLTPGIDESSIGYGNDMTQIDIDRLNVLYSD